MNLTHEELAKAECKNVKTELFFVNAAGVYDDDIEAKATCKVCPIATRCLEAALANDEQGIWGGTDEYDRSVIRGNPRRVYLKLRTPRRRPQSAAAMRRAERYKAQVEAKKREEARKANRRAYSLEMLTESNAKRIAEANAKHMAKYTDALSTGLPARTKRLLTLRVENPGLSMTDLGNMMEPVMNKNQVASCLRRAVSK